MQGEGGALLIRAACQRRRAGNKLNWFATTPFKCDCSLGTFISMTRASGERIKRTLVGCSGRTSSSNTLSIRIREDRDRLLGHGE